MQTIIPHLWFDQAAEEAARLYARLFPDSRIGRINRYTTAGKEIHGQPEGQVMSVDFELAGTRLSAINGGSHFHLNPSISLFVVLEDTVEVDRLWAALIEGGSVLMPLDRYPWSARYGWLADRYGLTWQLMVGDRARAGRTISPCLMFVGDQSGRAETAIAHYISLFPDSRVEGISRYEGDEYNAAGTVNHAMFRLAGETMFAMDSGLPHDFTFNEAFALMVACADQSEIDRYWAGLSAAPEAERCGWLKDRFGLSWIIAPDDLGALIGGEDPTANARVMEAMLAMRKLDQAALRNAAGL